MIEMTDSGASLLAEAIVKNAVAEYINTYRVPYPERTRPHREKIERLFFNKPWFEVLTMGNISVSATLKVLQERGSYAHWKYTKGCSTCKNRACKHKMNAENFLLKRECEKDDDTVRADN